MTDIYQFHLRVKIILKQISNKILRIFKNNFNKKIFFDIFYKYF